MAKRGVTPCEAGRITVGLSSEQDVTGRNKRQEEEIKIRSKSMSKIMSMRDFRVF